MMDLGLFARGLILGLSIAAPVGPIGALCIRRTFAEGRMSGLFTGLGAATADGIYGAIAALGLTVVTSTLVGQQFWIRLIGGAFLVYLGLSTFFARPSERAADVWGAGLAGAFASTFVLTLTNPMTILSFVAAFAGLGLGAGIESGSPANALLLVAGVTLGSATWWLLLSFVVSRARHRVGARGLAWVNRISGLVITTFGAWSLAGALQVRS